MNFHFTCDAVSKRYLVFIRKKNIVFRYTIEIKRINLNTRYKVCLPSPLESIPASSDITTLTQIVQIQCVGCGRSFVNIVDEPSHWSFGFNDFCGVS